jgi:tetratricopeptide (TPR) repeat protein
MSEKPRDLSQLRLDVPPDVAALVMRCLAKDPAARPKSAEEVLRQIEATLAGPVAVVSSDEPAVIRRAFVVYAIAFGVAAVVAWGATQMIGLPDWVVPGMIIVMALGLPVLALAALSRFAAFRALGDAAARTTGVPWLTTTGARSVRRASLFSWRRLAIGGGISLGGFGAIVTGYMVTRATGIGPAASLLSRGQVAVHQPVLVTDFNSAPDDSALARLAADAVRVGLGQSAVISVASPELVADAMRRMRLDPARRLTLNVARELAAREGIKLIVDGDLIRTGETLLLTTRLVATDSGNLLATNSAGAASSDRLIPAADRVTRALRTKVGESFKVVRGNPPLDQVTTASREAYELFSQGRRLWLIEAKPLEAIEVFKRAVEIDTLFASAWRALSILAAGNRAEPALAARAAEMAFRYREHTSENERLLIEGTYYASRDAIRSEAAYERLWKRSGEPPSNLGDLLNRRREYARAESLYRALAAQSPLGVIVVRDFIVSLMNQGKVREADSVVRDARLRFPQDERPRLWSVEVTCAQLLLDACDAAIDSIESPAASPRLRQLAKGTRVAVAALRGRMTRARTTRLEGRSQLPPLQAALDAADDDISFGGSLSRAVARLDSIADSLTGGQLAATAERYVFAGRPDRARVLLDRWHREKPESLRTMGARAMALAVRAWMEEAEGRWTDAIADWQASDVLPEDGRPFGVCTSCVPRAMARMYEALNRPDSAIYWHEKYLATPEFILGNIATFTPNTYERLAALYERVGNRAKAVEYSSKFADLWKNADPELQPRVAAARARIARLTGG